MKKRINILILLSLAICLMGCKKENEKEKNIENQESKTYIYYLDNKETQVVREAYSPKGNTTKEQLSEYAKALKEKKPKDLTYKKALPDIVTMTVNEDIENEQLTLYFDNTYFNLTGASEVLCRAAIVKTFCQIE
ncbi:MAG: GerMN domain-containing protein, partial [Acetivibrio sp.]